MSKIGIPSATHVADRRVARILDAIKQALDQIFGDSGAFGESALTVSQLEGTGVIGVDGTTIFKTAEPVTTPSFLTSADDLENEVVGIIEMYGP